MEHLEYSKTYNVSICDLTISTGTFKTMDTLLVHERYEHIEDKHRYWTIDMSP